MAESYLCVLVLSIVTACHITAQDNQYCNCALDFLQHGTDFKDLAGIKKGVNDACFICQELNPTYNYWMFEFGITLFKRQIKLFKRHIKKTNKFQAYYEA